MLERKTVIGITDDRADGHDLSCGLQITNVRRLEIAPLVGQISSISVMSRRA
jgi:hypothetical protein